MKRILFLLCLAAALGLYTGCDGPKRQYAEILDDLGGDGYVDREKSEEEIASLNKKITELRKEVDRTISARYDLGVYYKMLAVEYIELQMFGPALEALEQAIQISPVSSTLQYYAGVSSAHLAKAIPEPQRRNTYLEKAEFYYRRAIELKNNYVDALFGLSVLYVFEMGKPQEAKPLLEDALLYSSGNTQVMFLLARVYAELGDVDAAVAMYEKIAETTKVDSERREAEENKRRLLDEFYES